MEGAFRFKGWFLNALGLIHGGAYYRNFTVYSWEVHPCINNKEDVNRDRGATLKIGGGGGTRHLFLLTLYQF